MGCGGGGNDDGDGGDDDGDGDAGGNDCGDGGLPSPQPLPLLATGPTD
jgi:hypothetical protein